MKTPIETPEELTRFIVDCFESAAERDIYTGFLIIFDVAFFLLLF